MDRDGGRGIQKDSPPRGTEHSVQSEDPRRGGVCAQRQFAAPLGWAFHPTAIPELSVVVCGGVPLDLDPGGPVVAPHRPVVELDAARDPDAIPRLTPEELESPFGAQRWPTGVKGPPRDPGEEAVQVL